MSRRSGGFAAALITAGALLPAASANAGMTVAQLSGGNGCIAGPPVPKKCSSERALGVDERLGSQALAVAPDGRHVYAAAVASGSLIVFRREPDGSLAKIEVQAVPGANAVVVSGDGGHAYVAGRDGVHAFSRDAATGRLSAAGCAGGREGCAGAPSANGADALAVGADSSIYAAGGPASALTELTRDSRSGALSFAGCWSPDGAGGCTAVAQLRGPTSVAAAPDGSLYLTARATDALLEFVPDPLLGRLELGSCHSSSRTGGCAAASGLEDPRAVAVSPDGANVYVGAVASNALATFSRADGAISQLECLAVKASNGCVGGLPTGGPTGLAVSEDGRELFVAADDPGQSLTQLDRSSDGTLAAAGCIAERGAFGACASGRGLFGARSVALAPDGREVYVMSHQPAIVALTRRAGVVFDYLELSPRGILRVPIECPAGRGGTCAGRVRVKLERDGALPRGTRAHNLTASGKFRIAAGSSGSARVRLSRRGRSLAWRLREFVVRASAREPGTGATRLRLPIKAFDPKDRFVGLVSEDLLAICCDAVARARILQRQGRAGVRLIRQTFDWSVIEPRRGEYDFGFYDDYVQSLAAEGMQILPILFNPPAWASSKPRRSAKAGTYPPRRASDMARFAQALVGRYGLRGSFWREHPELPRLPIRSWQVWNEPNLRQYWPAGPSARAYARLLRVVAKAIKRTERGAEVVTAGLSVSRSGIPLWRYLGGLYKHGARRHFDVLAVNPYAASVGGLRRRLRAVRRQMKRRGDPKTPIWVTELGWSDKGPKSRFRKGRRGQARMISSAVELFGRLRKPLRLRGFVYFNWRDSRTYRPGFDFYGLHTGLLDRRGRAKPAYRAFVRSVKRLPLR